ncbi:MAG TPA: LysM-like peptidoglycan-binding domain-containing protein [Verrucomicrobiae bacterium]|jgi:cell envelope opacity-associated protein A|nr:LysM-like peptidoglycan-binding domain-containing protein [Verrucomicrobiae bacterium]
MNRETERNLGEQPIAQIMRKHNLKPHDLVAISSVEMTHKMVSRACKGRRLTLNTQSKVLAALNRATGNNYSLRDLFNY